MITAAKQHRLPESRPRCQILGISFFTGSPAEAVQIMEGGGLLTVPAAPALKDIPHNKEYREALLGADLTITDSALMVLIWNCLNSPKIPRISGLTYLREFLNQVKISARTDVFWIMAGAVSAERNIRWLASQGIEVSSADYYVAPMYKSAVTDPALLAILHERRPKHIVVTLGGGTQERLGLYLKNNLQFNPAIHCIGAAIAFLSGDQVRIPEWADRLWLGWLLRCISEPKRYISRYWSARKLLPLMLRHGQNLPPSVDA